MILRNAVRLDTGEWAGDLFNTEDGKIYSGTITIKARRTHTDRLPDQFSASRNLEARAEPDGRIHARRQAHHARPSPKPGLGH